MRQSIVLVAVSFVLASSLGACAPKPSPATSTPTDVEAPVEPAPVAGAERITGTLVHDPIDYERKSVRAYLGDDLRLEGDGQTFVLDGSDAVSREALIAAAGKRVALHAVRKAATVPRPDEQYPMDMDGKPLARPDRWQVVRLEVLP